MFIATAAYTTLLAPLGAKCESIKVSLLTELRSSRFWRNSINISLLAERRKAEVFPHIRQRFVNDRV
jgi:hypothetical protein